MTGSPNHSSFKRQSLFLSCAAIQAAAQDRCVPPRCRLLVSGRSAACGSGASGEHRYTEVWDVQSSTQRRHYSRIASVKVTASFVFPLSVCSRGRDPWPRAVQPDSVWTPGAVSRAHGTLGDPRFSRGLDLVLPRSRGE